MKQNLVTDDCVAFLQKQAKSLDLPIKVYQVHPGKPIVVLTWIGTQPSEPAILLNSHMDVVPVFEVSILLIDSLRPKKNGKSLMM